MYRPKVRLAVNDTNFINYPNLDRLFNKNYLQILDEYIKISSEEDIKYLLNKLSLFNSDIILELFTKREKNSNIIIPDAIKNHVLKMLQLNISNIHNRISEYEKRGILKW